jgi:hypothetical protein
MSEGGAPWKAPRLNHDSQLEFSFCRLLMDLSDCAASVVKVRAGAWRFTFLVDSDPANGLLRDLEDDVRWIASRCAA